MKKDKIIKMFMCLYLALFGFKTIVLSANGSNRSCEDWGATKQDLQNIFNFLKIVVPLLVIGLSSYDFIKAVTAKEEKGVKKAFNIFLKRMIYAVLFFFLPVIINLILDFIGASAYNCIS